MKPSKSYPSAQFLNECFTYDPENGRLFWKERPKHHFKRDRDQRTFNSRRAGTEAGTKQTRKQSPEPSSIGVVAVWNGKYERMTAHRIIYAIMGIPIPDGFEVDHKDRNPYNNRWDNLRLATRSQNTVNQKRRKRKINLPRGVYPHEGRFQAKISFQGKQIPIGRFVTPELAKAAYEKKAAELFGGFAAGN